MDTDYIYKYWARSELGRIMIESDYVSESDLLILMPNNFKRMHGLPMKRISEKRKSKYKRLRKRQILSYKLFGLLEEIIDATLPRKLDESLDQLIDIKNCLGDKRDFT